MKKILFWTLFGPIMPVYMVGLLMQMIGEGVENLCHMFEDWCFDQ